MDCKVAPIVFPINWERHRAIMYWALRGAACWTVSLVLRGLSHLGKVMLRIFCLSSLKLELQVEQYIKVYIV